MNDKELLLALFAQLQREKTVSIPQVAKLLACTEERVESALEKLVFAYDSVSVYLDLQSTYARLVDDGSDRILRLTPDETSTLLDALEAQGIGPESTLSRKLVEAKGFLGDAREGRLRTVGANADAPLAQTLAESCEEHRLLRIAYHGAGDVQARRRDVEPYGIENDGGHSVLVAFCRTAGGWRTFRLDRIRSAEQLDEVFEPRDGGTGRDIGAIGGAPAARIRIAADVPLPSWPGLRRKRTAKDGSVEVSVPWTGGAWLPKHIASMGGAAVPVEPAELVDAVRGYARRLLDEL